MMEFVNGKDDIPYMKWKKKIMVETTNQFCFSQQLLEGANCLEAWTL
jgi:hypothetical protein